MPDFFQKNFELIKNNNETLAEQLAALAPNPNIKAIPVRSKAPSAEDNEELYSIQAELPDGKKVTLHSRYDPKTEARRLIEKYEIGDLDIFVVFGYGMGYHVFELLKSTTQESQIFVVEKDLNVFRMGCLWDF